MNEVQLTDILLTAAGELAAALGIAAAMPGRSFEPPVPVRYLEVVEFKNTTGSPTYGGAAVFQGILQIAVHEPNNNEGSISPLTVATQIASAFYKNRVIYGVGGRVKINENPSVLTAIVEPNKTIYPISVPYVSSRGDS